MSAARKLGELLVVQQKVSIEQLEQAKNEQKTGGGSLGRALVKLGHMDEKSLTDFMAQQFNVPAIDLSTFEIDPEVIKLVPRDKCEKYMAIPISKAGNTLVIALADPSNIFALDDLRFITRMAKLEVVVAADQAIQNAIDRYYSGGKNAYADIMSQMEKEDEKSRAQVQALKDKELGEGDLFDLEKGTEDAPVVKFVNQMLSDAIRVRASDIHIEPYEKRFRVRFRVDGNLVEKIHPPTSMAGAITSRIKILSSLDISERRRPQDGRLKLRMKGGREIDFRVSVLPTLFGEKVVLRLLDKGNLQLDMTKLGFEQDDLDKFKNAIHQPYGMVLITGPTGSGKSTTIYSALAELNQPDVNISTAEDPVEYNLEGINQVQVNAEVDLTFASALRSFLRQDPDVVMVGEIRDFETAEIAFKAALTGHMVVSTLHTNDAPSTINRLLNMGCEPFLVCSAVNLVVAQRLVRKLCQHCKSAHSVAPDVLKDLGIPEAEIPTFQVFKAEGCSQCNDIGYKGRIAIYEVMEFTEGLKEMVFQNVSHIELKKAAVREGSRTLRMSAVKKLREGLTSIEEVLEVSAKDDA